MKVVGANPNAKVTGQEELQGKTNYLIGKDQSKWRTGVSNYKKVHYEEVYPGIDLVYYGNQRKLEYDFVVKPGADPKAIALEFEGMEGMSLDDEGNLVLQTLDGKVVQQKPIVYQYIAGKRQPVGGNYVIQDSDQVAFLIDNYDQSKNLVIDPIIQYSTFLGDSGREIGYGIAVDDSGQVYVTGYTKSSDFPVTVGAYDSSYSELEDVFITKLSSDGSAMLYSTYIGGEKLDIAYGIDVNSSENAYISGYTWSNDFPSTAGALQSIKPNNLNAHFVIKMSVDGSALEYATFLGAGSSHTKLDVDDAGNAFVTGYGHSDFPVTPGSYENPSQYPYLGSSGVFIAKLKADGSELVYGVLIKGIGSGIDIAVDPSGNAHVIGQATTATEFPITPGAFQPNYAAGAEGFVLTLNASGTDLINSTYLGGTKGDYLKGVATDSLGNTYVTGLTGSADFPTTSGAFLTSSPYGNSFVTKLGPTGSVIYSTYLGPPSNPAYISVAQAIVADDSGYAYIVGNTADDSSPPGIFPVTPGAVQSAVNAIGTNAFVVKMNSIGSDLVYASYLGGYSNADTGLDIALDSLGDIYVTGETTSFDFPTTPGTVKPNGPDVVNNAPDAFIVKMRLQIEVTPPLDIVEEATTPITIVELGAANATDLNGNSLTATASSSTGTIAVGPPITGSFPVGVHTVTWFATDSNGDTNTATQTISILDNDAPVVTPPPNITVAMSGTTTPVDLGTASANDLIDGVLIPIADNTGPFTLGTHTVTWSATDTAGNTGTASQIVNIYDPTIQAPVVTPPADVLAEATGPTMSIDLGAATSLDSEDGVLIPTADNTGPFSVGIHTITWSVTDSHGNVGTATQTVRITDTTAPLVTVPPDITLEATGPTTEATLGDGTATDIVDGALTPLPDITGPFTVGVHTITWAIDDIAGNTGTATQKVTITDTTPPTVIAPPDINATATGDFTTVNLGSGSASDLVDGELTLEANISPPATLGPGTPPTTGDFLLRYNYVFWSATDAAGNIATATQIVFVVDDVPPVVTPPPDITIEATGPLTEVDIGMATAEDNIAMGHLGISSDNEGPFSVGVHTITWSTYDSVLNLGTATQTVTVTDTTPPIVIVPPDITLEATGPTTEVTLGVATATDIVDGTLIPIPDNAGPFGVGVHSITWSVTDNAGNTGTQIQTVTITDTTPPIVTPPDDIIISTIDHLVTVDLGSASATDIADGAVIPTPDNTGPFTPGIYTITWSAIDSQENIGTATQTVTITIATDLAETHEVKFLLEDSKDLLDKATELGSAVNIYEYVRNNYENQLYHGSISGSINTFLGQRGNDVDIASTIIAMLRSQKIPARYAVGNVTMKKEDLMNWLNVKNFDLAVSLLRDQGIQGPGPIGPVVSADGNSVTFERVWVQALVAYKDYRGIGQDETVECFSVPISSSCIWVDLDPSFKLREYHNQGIDIYGQLPFDYNRYFHSIRNNDIEYRDKNPLEVYKLEVLKYLQTQYPGKTLEDVKDPGVIIKEELGILPSSLPFVIVGEIRVYDSILEQDSETTSSNPAGPKKWRKNLKVTFENSDNENSIHMGTFSLVDLSTKKLILGYEPKEFPTNPTNLPPLAGNFRHLGNLYIHSPI